MRNSSPSRRPNTATRKIANEYRKLGTEIHLHGGLVNTDRVIRNGLGIGSKRSVTTFFSGSRPGDCPNVGPMSAEVAMHLAASRHTDLLSGGGSFEGSKPDSKTGIMGWLAHGMITGGNAHFVITEGLLGNEKLVGGSRNPVHALCLVEKGGASRLSERKGALIVPTDFAISFRGGVGTHSEDFTVITKASISHVCQPNDRSLHRSALLINSYQDTGIPWQMQDKAFTWLIKSVREARDCGMLGNFKAVAESLLQYTPLPGMTKEAIAKDVNIVTALAHMRAHAMSPDMVEPLQTKTIREMFGRNVQKSIRGQLMPALYNTLSDSDLRQLSTWKPHIEKFAQITGQRPIVDRKKFYLESNA